MLETTIQRLPIHGLEEYIEVFDAYWFNENMSSFIMIEQIPELAVYLPERLFYILSKACNKLMFDRPWEVKEIVIDTNLTIVHQRLNFDKEICEVYSSEVKILNLETDTVEMMNTFVHDNLDYSPHKFSYIKTFLTFEI